MGFTYWTIECQKLKFLFKRHWTIHLFIYLFIYVNFGGLVSYYLRSQFKLLKIVYPKISGLSEHNLPP